MDDKNGDQSRARVEPAKAIESYMERWHRRFQRSLAIYEKAFRDEEFDNVVAVLVTGAFLEALLWVGVQIGGYKPSKADKDLTLKPVIGEALRRGLIGKELASALRDFADMRNEFAHDIDCELDNEAIDGLIAQLPVARRETVARCLANMPGYTTGSKARVLFGELAGWTYESLRSNLTA